MKSYSQSTIPLQVPQIKEETHVKTLYQSPYLKAILSDKHISDTAKMISVANSSMAAALRYISNSR
jgi:hypothetical protein